MEISADQKFWVKGALLHVQKALSDLDLFLEQGRNLPVGTKAQTMACVDDLRAVAGELQSLHSSLNTVAATQVQTEGRGHFLNVSHVSRGDDPLAGEMFR